MLYDRAARTGRHRLDEPAITGRWSTAEGDFFASVPEGFDVHLLTAIIHDWNDDAAVRILQNCAAALPAGGRIIVVDSELVPGARNSFAQSTDALMLAFTPGGRERTAPEFEAIWERAGLRCTGRATMPSLLTRYELVPR